MSLQAFNTDLHEFYTSGSYTSLLKAATYIFTNKLQKMYGYIIDIVRTRFPYNLDLSMLIIPFIDNADDRVEWCEQILERFPFITQSTSMYVLKILANCYGSRLNKYVYPINKVIEPSKNACITVTITACKRINLFIETVTSFVNCCKDINLIKEWICVDDNSSEDDRKKMRDMFPFIRFIYKGTNDIGHERSMNILLDNVKTPYMFHLEDDFKFFVEKNYMSILLDIINAKPDIGQAIINKNYAELHTEIEISGGLFNISHAGNRYYIHEQFNSIESFREKYGANATGSFYWPGLTFRPSLLKVDILKAIGRFHENVQHFEREYADRYKHKGFVSAFMEGVYCMHTGRHTSQQNDPNSLNAYILNNQQQFKCKYTQPFKVHVINLDRRVDRYDQFQRKVPTRLIYDRFSAVDGKKLVSSVQLQRIFDTNDYDMKVGMVGCALSHLQLWCNIVNNTYSEDVHLILEDDVEFCDQFLSKLNTVYELLDKRQWDICYIAHHKYPHVTYNESTVIIEQYSTSKSLQVSAGGTIGYFINKTGCKRMLEYINRVGMTNCIDTMQQKSADTLKVLYTEPMLLKSDFIHSSNTDNNKVDTDIQRDPKSLTVDTRTKLLNEVNQYGLEGVEITDIAQLDNTKLGYTYDKTITSYDVVGYHMYGIDNKVWLFIPEKYSHRGYVDRLKKGNIWSVTDCLNYTA
jgi:GR25 family glycosyltransferase involved in LPS biosynthesis